MTWALAHTRWGLWVRMVGDSADAARALGTSVNRVRIAATTAGGFIAGLGGACLSLYYPGSWNEGLSSGQGLIAVALVIFARWHPLRCLGAALLFGGAGALGPALQINVMFPLGIAIALGLTWALAHTRWGLWVRMVGDSADAARALGTSVNRVRIAATTAGGFIAGLGGACLSLYYPGSWNEGLSSGQGLIAVALVIFARWHPLRCLGAALLFGGAGALGPALQSVGVSGGYYLFNAAPYVLTLAILVWTCSPRRSLQGAPMELTVTR